MQWTTTRKLRVLDFDMENRPLNYVGEDFTFGEVTAIAWKFSESKEEPACVLLEPGMTTKPLLALFRTAYAEADVVTGHNILRHDLRFLNGACLEMGLAPLHPKLVCDTYRHLKQRRGVGASQENLAKMLGVNGHKIAMSQTDWRMANRLTPEGIEKTRKRVTGDVIQHIVLREKLLELGWLRPPVRWSP